MAANARVQLMDNFSATRAKVSVKINLGETFCHKFCLVTFNFTINTMFNFEHPFARNGLPTLGSGTNVQVLLTTKKLYYSCMAIPHLFASSLFNASSTL
jgi:hypothetical protein